MFNLDTPLEALPFPVQRLDAEERDLWLLAYVEAYEETGDEQKAELAAWGAINGEMVRRQLGIKTVDGKTIIGGWAMLFTDAENLDLVKTYFDETTDLALDYYPQAPLLYEHDAGFGIIGKRTLTEVYPRGVWMEHELHADHALFHKIVSETKRGVLFYSSDSLSHVVQVGYNPEDSHLGLWFLAACSLTQNPAEPSLGPVSFTGVMEAIKSARGKRKAFADAVDTSQEEQNQSQDKESEMELLEQIRIALGLPEGTAPEVILQTVQTLADTATKMGDMNEEEREASKEVQTLNAIREALTEDDVAPNDEELLVILDAVVEMLTDETSEEEEPVVVNAQALKGVVSHLKGSNTAVTRMPYTTNPNAKRAGGNGNRKGFGTYIAKKDSSRILAEGILALVEGNARGLRSLGFKPSSKSFSSQAGAGGGWLPDRTVAAELLELFYAKSVVREAGATVVPMIGIDSTLYRKMLTGATARWAAESQPNANAEATFGLVELNLRQAVGDMRLPNKLLKNATSVSIEQTLMDDLSKAISLLVDLSAIRGTGAKPSGSVGRELLGIRNTPGVEITPLTSAGRTPKIEDFVDAWGRIEDADVPSSDTWKHVMSPRTHRTIRNMKDTTGQAIPEEAFTQAYDVLKTTQIPNNLTATSGGATNCSEIYFADWQYLIIGMGHDIEFRVDTSRYIDTDETYIRADMMIDVALSHTEAFQVLTNVRP
jgi:HK97 family phage major capsid protein